MPRQSVRFGEELKIQEAMLVLVCLHEGISMKDIVAVTSTNHEQPKIILKVKGLFLTCFWN